MPNLVQGYGVWVGVNGVEKERDSFTCAHCNTVVFIEPRARPEDSGGFCRMCMKCICGPCTNHGCTPFEKKLEQVEARQRLWDAVTG